MPLPNKDSFAGGIQIITVLKGTVITIVISFFLSIGAGFVFHFSSITEQSMPWFAVTILAASSFCGSLVAGRGAGNRGLYHGAAVGVLFFFFAWFLAGIVLPGQEALGAVYKLLVTSFAGAIGGIVGVGMS